MIGALRAPWNLNPAVNAENEKWIDGTKAGKTYRKSIRLFCVDQMNTPDLDAAATYTPFLDSARAVMAPEHASSERVVDLVQSEREIVMISGAPLG